ncbi:MAG: signal peptidase II [Chloroflexi bacterium]|nr:signal peptidase II [Chloroflexota bacterium]NOG63335.1 signal peptidase II [Chloroflexota bacterium]
METSLQNDSPNPAPENTAATPQWALLFGVAVQTIITDQITKWIVVQSLDYGETWVPIPALKSIFDITYTRNTGAAFGMAQEFGNIFLLIAVVVVGAIVYYYRKLPTGSWLVRLTLGLQMGGALGNALDRITRGYVVDFFHVHGYPIFNVADSSIVVGVVVLVMLLWWEDRKIAKKEI